ncbi:penicillin-binding protein 2 [Prosthecobacter sp.]|uniref:penicillin-binding protein 2 n=1 Tax=Prosthecobacter sp. TaxID=1965333 RepID=UPI002489C985|nr:penicillin-binding protein 2 [Prosthecobacter sp.]MDI1313555.1 penicillin-binding protein 2 [Prosthecobacter sp.]
MVVKYRFRLYLFSLAMMCGFGLLVFRLWSLQIDRREEFAKMIPGAKKERARIPGPRGEIKDRNGIVLATNKASFEVRINLAEVVTEYKRLAKIKKAAVPEITFEISERGIKRMKPELDIYKIFEETITARMLEMGVHKDYSVDSLRVHYRSFGGAVPWVYRDDLTFAEFSRIAEHNLGLPGVTVAERASRVYPLKSVACHILGYVRLPDDQRASAEDRKGWDYYVPDDFGVAGVEKSFDNYLKGKPGVRVMQRDQRGRPVGEVDEEYVEPRKGNDVYLTLDVRMQLIADRALRDAKIGRGAVAVIEPNSGEVLAMVSVPSYDPNQFIPSIQQSDWDALMSNPTIPLINRAVRGHVPGSTFKIPISFAGCLAGINMNHFNCSGSVTYGNKAMQCWIQRQNGGSHGMLGLSDAIKYSCNCFFYRYGNAAGISNITKVGKILGVGTKTGIELDDEDPGILPNPDWLRAHRPAERWSDGYTANTSIGQGMVLASPLQMASVSATVANGGKAWSPHLLKRVMDHDQAVLENPPSLRGDLSASVKPEQIEVIRRGMWKVVNDPSGTGKGARITGVEVAGKTGTAQNWRLDAKRVRHDDNHTWFICFAPYKDPKFAVAVLVQNGKSGGGCAAPVARRVLEQCLALDNPKFTVAITAMEPAEGNFNHIASVQYADAAVPEALNEDEDGDVGTGVSAPEPDDADAPRVNATPNISRKADSAGSAGRSSGQNVPKAVPVRRVGIFNRGSSQGTQPSDSAPSGGGFFRRIFR